MRDKIKAFIVENFLFGKEDGLNGDASFLDEGIVDSTGILELVSFLEEEFLIAVCPVTPPLDRLSRMLDVPVVAVPPICGLFRASNRSSLLH